MIKLPREVNSVIRTLRDARFDAYAVGGCVRDALAGLKPYEWDIATDAGIEDLKGLFPNLRVLSEKYSIGRMEFVEEIFDKDGNSEGEEGFIVDISTFRKNNVGDGTEAAVFAETIEEDLQRRDFTINAIADSGIRIVDPTGGIEDSKKHLIRTIGDSDQAFKEQPIRMMRALRLSSDLNYDLTKDAYQSIKNNAALLAKVPLNQFRNEFIKIMGGKAPGKSLHILMETGILNLIFGDNVVKGLSRNEKTELIELCEGIDKTKPVAERRLGLLYSTLSTRKAVHSIEKMEYSAKLSKKLIEVAYDLPSFYFANSKEALKLFIYEHGWDGYEYMLGVEKARRIALDLDTALKIEGRMYFVSEIKKMGEPIFPEDLFIDGNDLLEAGIAKDPEEAKKLLSMVVERVHYKPELNHRDTLLELAAKYKKNKLKAAVRSIPWLN